MSLLQFRDGQQVAVFSMGRDEDTAVQELAAVVFADAVYVRLSNGQTSCQRNGHGVSPTAAGSYIVPATEVHRTRVDQRLN
jgi:hypothetical protein